MPKKFSGVNTKAEVARERKASAKQAVADKKRLDEEDAYWRDDDRHGARKDQRKAERERKRLEVQERKQASKKLLEEEEAQLEERAGAERLTRAKIAEVQRREREAVEAAGACALQKGVTVEELDTDNPNHLLRRRQMEGEVDARTVDEAIVVLGISKDTPEMHPEKRMKAAYAVFEEQELPRLKEENPHLRMSQVKQLLRKEWMKSPENPVNKLL